MLLPGCSIGGLSTPFTSSVVTTHFHINQSDLAHCTALTQQVLTQRNILMQPTGRPELEV
jgi:hypothetical protein